MRTISLALLIGFLVSAPLHADPRTPAEKLEDGKILVKMSPRQKLTVEPIWDTVIARGPGGLLPRAVDTLYEHGMGASLEREAMRFAKSDPACTEFRDITGCKTDTQYKSWGVMFRPLRERALAIARDAKAKGTDPRDLFPEFQKLIRQAGGSDWIDRAGR